MLRFLRGLVLATSALLMGAASWAEIELSDNAFLRAWLEQHGFWWFAYLPVAVGMVGGSCWTYAIFKWPRVLKLVPLKSGSSVDGTVTRAQEEPRLTQKGEPFKKYEEEAGNVTLPTSSQGPSIGATTGPGGKTSISGSNASVDATGEGGVPDALPSPESITIPEDSALSNYVTNVDRNYRLVEPPKGEGSLLRELRAGLPRRKNPNDKRTVDRASEV